MSPVTSLHSELVPGSCGCTEEGACILGNAAGQTNLGPAPSAEPPSKSRVLEVPPARSQDAFEHFSRKLGFETDCSDVHAAQTSSTVDFVLVDVRNADLYRAGHVPKSINLPVDSISQERLEGFSPGTSFVVYCAGPHCNGANKAAIRLAKLGLPVKEMIGGITGWLEEGLTLEK